MPRPAVLIHYSPGSRPASPLVSQFAESVGRPLLELDSIAEVIACVSRAYPAGILIDGSEPVGPMLDMVRHLKDEPFTAVVPVVINLEAVEDELIAAALETGADEVITPALSERERMLRLGMALRRAERDVSVHPTTRLPGTVQIERDFSSGCAAVTSSPSAMRTSTISRSSTTATATTTAIA
jgi:CheY-like chemotaxis protein